MLRDSLFGRPCRDMCAQLVNSDQLPAGTGGCAWKAVKGAVWQRSIGNCSRCFEGISESGIFHGIINYMEITH
jgi:hypothetical protein